MQSASGSGRVPDAPVRQPCMGCQSPARLPRSSTDAFSRSNFTATGREQRLYLSFIRMTPTGAMGDPIRDDSCVPELGGAQRSVHERPTFHLSDAG